MQTFSCFLINLEKDVDRLRFMDAQLSSLGISYERIPGVYGPSLSETDVSSLYLETKQNKLSLGEIGCALSHRLAYKTIVEKNIPYSLILEDDVSLPEYFLQILQSEIEKNEHKKSWDYVSFDYYAYGFDFFKIWVPGIGRIYAGKKGFVQKMSFLIVSCIKGVVLFFSTIIEEVQKRVYKNNSIRPMRPTYFAGCYLVTTEGARKILQVHDKILYIADQLPNIARKQTNLKFKIYTPLLVKQLKKTFASNLAPNK